jgi:hypothetical protein
MDDVMAAPGLDNLHIIEAGPIPANPSELLSTSAMADFLRDVSAEYDIVLIDTPPVLPVTDSAIVAGQADGVLLVYQAGKVGRLVLKRAKAHLESTRAKVWGVVLNDVQTEVAGYNYTHYYTHYYGEETAMRREDGVLQRAWAGVRARLGRAPADEAGLEVVAGPSRARPPRRPGQRSLWIGLVALGGVAGLVAWQAGVFGTGSTPLTQLRQRLGIGPGAPAPAQPLAPVTPGSPGLPTSSSPSTPIAGEPPPAGDRPEPSSSMAPARAGTTELGRVGLSRQVIRVR